MRKKNILVLGRNSYVDPLNISRSLYERVLAPLGLLSHYYDFDVCQEGSVNGLNYSKYDILFLSRHKSIEALNLACKFKDAGKIVVYDLDDWVFEFPPNSIANWNSTSMLNCRDILNVADLVISAARKIHERMIFLNLKSVWIPTGIWVPEWNIKARASKARCIFINGDSMKIYKFRDTFFDVINSEFPKLGFQLDLVADNDEEFKGRCNYNFHSSIPREKLSDFLGSNAYSFSINPVASEEDADVMPFMECKSPIKYLLYGAHGIPGIYSNLSLYSEVVENGKTGLLVDNNFEKWSEGLGGIADPRIRQDISSNAYEDVKLNHNLELMSIRIHEALESL